MRVFKGLANALLMVTLIRPVVRLMVRRWRKQAQESPAATIGIPVQELVEAALIEELAPLAIELEPSLEETVEELAGRSMIRTLFIAGIAIALTAGAAIAIATVIRRQREGQKGSEWVAVPVGGTPEEVEEAEEAIEEALID